MSSHIEWTTARYAVVNGTATPGEFENDNIVNDVACLVITTGDGDGIVIEGRPEELVKLAEGMLELAQVIAADTDATPHLRSLYGRT